MRIDSSSFDNRTPDNTSLRRSETAGETVNGVSEVRQGSSESHVSATGHSGDLARLANLVGNSPEVRGDVVQAARQRVQTGEYFTREAAEGTADAMMGLPKT